MLLFMLSAVLAAPKKVSTQRPANMAVPVNVVSHITEVMSSSMGPLQKWKAVRECLVGHHLAYVIKAKASSFVVHERNRSGTLISPHGAHRKGAEIVQSGADLSLLTNSVCIELNPDLQIKNKQVAAFTRLTESTPYLASVSGAERFASLSSGHTCQFVKALMNGCQTCEPALADPNGKLGPHLWQMDADLKTMVESGWDWLVLPYALEVQFPKLPDLVQHALNCPNAVFGLQSEMEVACSIWERVQAMQGQTVNWDEISMECCQGGLMKNYAKSIGKFVKLYSGHSLALAYMFFCEYGHANLCAQHN